MKQITKNVYVETCIRGCNHGFVTTSDGIVLIDTPHKPSDAVKLKAEIAKHGQLRYIINTEPHGDHWTGNAYFDVPVIAHEGVRKRILETDMAAHVARVSGFGPEEPALMKGYKPNAPIITFKNGMTLHVGNHTFQMIHMPGHTMYQAAICIKEEGVVFTSDNIFHKVQTWLQEANPDLWLMSLESLRKLPEDSTAEFIQNEVYEAGKRHFAQAELRQWFKTLYEVLLGSEQGPRMGAFIKLYGRDNVVTLIERALAGEDLGKAA